MGKWGGNAEAEWQNGDKLIINYSDKMNIHAKNLLESIPILTGLI
jgi:hypothetical protein